MEQQNLKNHMRKAPQAYYFGMIMTLVSMLTTLSAFVLYFNDDHLALWINSSLPLHFATVCLSLILIGFYARSFALKAQDRAIRAEENLRHFSLTGNLLDSRLSISQVIALRFASDDEFVALAQKAAIENLTSKQIKQEIKNWGGDYYRV